MKYNGRRRDYGKWPEGCEKEKSHFKKWRNIIVRIKDSKFILYNRLDQSEENLWILRHIWVNYSKWSSENRVEINEVERHENRESNICQLSLSSSNEWEKGHTGNTWYDNGWDLFWCDERQSFKLSKLSKFQSELILKKSYSGIIMKLKNIKDKKQVLKISKSKDRFVKTDNLTGGWFLNDNNRSQKIGKW